MSYFIFTNNQDNVIGTLYRIAESQSDLNDLNINTSSYKIIEDSQINFDAVKYGSKFVEKYQNNTIIYSDVVPNRPLDKEGLSHYINYFKNNIKNFTDNNQSHSLFNRWNNYYNQLNSLDIDSITYPLNKSLEQYFKDQGQSSLNPLQLP